MNIILVGTGKTDDGREVAYLLDSVGGKLIKVFVEDKTGGAKTNSSNSFNDDGITGTSTSPVPDATSQSPRPMQIPKKFLRPKTADGSDISSMMMPPPSI